MKDVFLTNQAEHGYNSPTWLITKSKDVAREVRRLIPQVINQLPDENKANATEAWEKLGEIIMCSNRNEMLKIANDIAPEHLHVQANDLNWWKENLKSYGSLFLGEETTVAYGDKAAGPNHVLPTSGSARYTGGLLVHKFLKIVTWQKVAKGYGKRLAEVTANISRIERMEGHALAADIRVRKYFNNKL